MAKQPSKSKENTLSAGRNISGGGGDDDFRDSAQGANFPIKVELQRSGRAPTSDQPLWAAIRNRTNAISFTRYSAFIEELLCRGNTVGADAEEAGAFGSPSISDRRKSLAARPTIQGTESYKLLKIATEAFLIVECGIAYKDGEFFDTGSEFKDLDMLRRANEEARRFEVADVDVDALSDALQEYLDAPNGTYLRRVATAILGMGAGAQDEGLPYCDGVLKARLTCPSLVELIWSYWHEQGMLMQSMNSILMRFQNKRNGPDDPLVNFELDPLRGLNNLLWGFLQDESNRLSVSRRAYEYDHQYGLNLIGKSISQFHPADSRVRFVEAFHTLLHRAVQFYREDDDATIIADGFAMLNALREVHLLLGEGAHNQYGDLPWQSRKEMLITQWMMARPEVREFIRGRHMVPYQETWMGPVDDMKRLQGWSDVSVTHFHELGVYGEQILLSARFGDWIAINDQDHARNWARYWRPEIQRYIHAYAAVTGVDLSVDIADSRGAEARVRQPSELMMERNRMRPTARRGGLGKARTRRLEKKPAPTMSAPRIPVRK